MQQLKEEAALIALNTSHSDYHPEYPGKPL